MSIRSIRIYLLTSIAVVLVSGVTNANAVVGPGNIYIADYYGNETVQAWIGDSNGPAPGSGYLLNQSEDGNWMHFTINVGSSGYGVPGSNQAILATLLEPIDEGGGISDYLLGVAHQEDPVLDIYFASDPFPLGLPAGIPSIDPNLTPVMEIDAWQHMFGYNDGQFTAPGENDQLKFYVKSIPEPATLSLLALGGLAVIMRRSK